MREGKGKGVAEVCFRFDVWDCFEQGSIHGL